MLAKLLSIDRDALLCDLAETYHVYSFNQLPARTIAILSSGLRDTSRIMMKLNDQKISNDRMISIASLDCLKLLLWMNSEDGRRGINRPESLLNSMLEDKTDNDVMSFDSADEFERARKEILERSV